MIPRLSRAAKAFATLRVYVRNAEIFEDHAGKGLL
jgi:hypothetical protein